MAESDRLKWEERYSTGDYRPRGWPSPFLEEWLDTLPRGRSLDIACGAGRNAIRLAEAGYRTDAVDISETAVTMARVEAGRRGVEVDWQVADLDHLDLPAATYDLITVIRFVDRGLWPRLKAALTPDGWLLIEHHMDTPVDVEGPRSSQFRLRPGELLEAFSDLRIVFYSEGLEHSDRDRHLYALQRLVACNGDPGF